MIKEHDCVVLLEDLPEDNLASGDVGTVVHVHGEGQGYDVEFMTLTGNTVAIATVTAPQVRAIGARDIAHVRELSVA